MASLLTCAPPSVAQVSKPEAIVADGVPTIPAVIAQSTRRYRDFRAASFADWNPVDRSMLIATRFANVDQLHSVASPSAARRQVTFEDEPVVNARYSPSGDVLIAQKDIGGNEFFQLYRVENGALALLTDGKSRNVFGAFSRDGRWIGYTSTRRNGFDSDVWVIDPRDRASDRMVAKLSGNGWEFLDFSPRGDRAVIINRISVEKSDLYELDLASGKLSPLVDTTAAVSYELAKYAPDGTLWALSDADADFQRLGTLKDKIFTPVSREARWDVGDFDIAKNGRFIAYFVNEAGFSRLRILDLRSRRIRPVQLPDGVATGLRVAPWGAIGFRLTSPTIPGDVFSVDPGSAKLARWTESETGGLDPRRNARAELVTIRSFDGETVSGFLYRPDAARFPGKRPLVIDIHGGPEYQDRPRYLGAINYEVNELGIAWFKPNVRGSTGYGKRFVTLDNGPFHREDSVKDVGAFLDHLASDPAIDPARIGVTGVSYGGYMCYATAIRYADRLKGAVCGFAIANFVSFLENTQAYRRDLRRVEYGDERDPAQRAKLRDISPLASAGKLRVPLLVFTGANDPRVPPSEADQIIKAVRANGNPAWHVLANNEGHGFSKKENQNYYDLATVMFWEKVLGVSPR